MEEEARRREKVRLAEKLERGEMGLACQKELGQGTRRWGGGTGNVWARGNLRSD